MDNSDNVFSGICITSLFWLILIVIIIFKFNREITATEYNWAEKVCQSNEGLVEVAVDLGGLIALCVNSAEFKSLRSKVD
jgi:Flp pilus assembly protein protease CpaA